MASRPPRSSTAPPNSALSHREFCTRVRREVDALVNLVGGSDLAAKVPWSRTWRLADLVHHVGAIHRWAANIVEIEARRYLPIRDTDDWPPETRNANAARWLRAGGDRLCSVLEGADPDHKVWAWGLDQHMRFWPRRMTHETGIHRADVELTLGLEPHFDPVVAWDGVNEFFENLWRARAWRRSMGSLRGDGERIVFTATDCDEEWLVVRHPKGFEWSRHPHRHPPDADVTVSTQLEQLYLLLWKRIPLDAPQITPQGDLDVLRHWYRYSSV